MAERTWGRSSVMWAVLSIAGLAAWIGGVVVVAMSHDDPSDPAPILRAFAIGGGAFFAMVLVVAAIQGRRSDLKLDAALYRRLAVEETTDAVLRRATRGTRRHVRAYMLFGGVATGLALTAIGLGPDGPYEALYGTAVAVVVGWAIYGIHAVRSAFGTASTVLRPLGLQVTGIPRWVPRAYGGSGFLAGATTMTGTRHGRRVSITQDTESAVTAVGGTFGRHTIAAPDRLAALTGGRRRDWRKVDVTAGDGGLVVRRRGNGAGRWFLQDLLLAERLAEEWAVAS